MPLERLDNQDRITQLINFKTSTIFEMLISLQSAVQQWLHQEWTENIRKHLGDDFLTELREFFNSLDYGCEFIEMAIDYPDQHDINGFIEYVVNMNDRDFIFYMLGRVYPKEMLPTPISQKSLEQFIAANPNDYMDCMQRCFSWANDIKSFKEKMKKILLYFWNNFFKDIVKTYENSWVESIQEKQQFLIDRGGKALLELISGKVNLPEPLPENQPYTEVVFIPIINTTNKARFYYGYGNVTIIYNCKRTEKQVHETENLKKNLISTFRALGDENRYKLLILIADEDHQYNGKRLASKLNLSPSVVSRHLTQLRDCGLITEQKEDNRNITYRLVWEKITGISENIIQTLKDI